MLRIIFLGFSFIFFPIIKLFRFPGRKIRSFISPLCKIGKKVIVMSGCKIKENVVIGDYTYINKNTRIDKWTKSVGKFCSISFNVKIGLGPHPTNFVSTSPVFYSKSRGFVKKNSFNENENGLTVIGDDVWIGANAVILSGITIGVGAIIGAGCIVTKDVPPYAIVGGVPGKIIKYRFEEKIVKKLLKSRWWEKELNHLLKYKDLIDNPDEFVNAISNN